VSIDQARQQVAAAEIDPAYAGSRCRRAFMDSRDLAVAHADRDPAAWRSARAVDQRRIDQVEVLRRQDQRPRREQQQPETQ
jgi:hypothetical protein